jgi:hypothetical protein
VPSGHAALTVVTSSGSANECHTEVPTRVGTAGERTAAQAPDGADCTRIGCKPLPLGSEHVVSNDRNKPPLDEQTLQKLLEAAYVLQQHGDSQRQQKDPPELPNEPVPQQESSRPPDPQPAENISAEVSGHNDYTRTLAEIIETQNQIQLRHLGLDSAMELISEKLVAVTHASGAGIAILDEKIVRYRAAAGISALPIGAEVPLETAVGHITIATGKVLRSEDLNIEMQFDSAAFLKRGILSLLSVPIYRDGNVVGALELYFDKTAGYTEQDVHTCQLLAGMITESLERDAKVTLKKSIVDERSSLLALIENLQPNLAALAQAEEASRSPAGRNGKAAAPAELKCWKCGTNISPAEHFCGHCGALLSPTRESTSVQSKIASAWQRYQLSTEDSAQGSQAQPQESPDNLQAATASLADSASLVESALAPKLGETLPVEYTDPFAPRPRPSNGHKEEDVTTAVPQRSEVHDHPQFVGDEDQHPAIPGNAPSVVESEASDQIWTSAAKAREFLEKTAESQKSSRLQELWEAHRGDFYLALAVLFVLIVIRWGLWSHHSVIATGRGNQVSAASNSQPARAPEANLSLFDRLLISLGLAEAPEAPPDMGNPDVQVWVDPRTALYYCPGADLYGKTPKGRMTTQRDAQLDRFAPAMRKPCQ